MVVDWLVVTLQSHNNNQAGHLAQGDSKLASNNNNNNNKTTPIISHRGRGDVRDVRVSGVT